MKNIKTMTTAAVLITFGIVIPMFMPKILVPPASYTLASHVPVFVAMFISPIIAVMVALGTALGFLLTTTPEIAARALSHVVFAYIGSLYIRKNKTLLTSLSKTIMFSATISLIHVVFEIISITPFYFINNSNQSYINTIILLVGIGGFIHSIIDFYISVIIVKRVVQK